MCIKKDLSVVVGLKVLILDPIVRFLRTNDLLNLIYRGSNSKMRVSLLRRHSSPISNNLNHYLYAFECYVGAISFLREKTCKK